MTFRLKTVSQQERVLRVAVQKVPFSAREDINISDNRDESVVTRNPGTQSSAADRIPSAPKRKKVDDPESSSDNSDSGRYKDTLQNSGTGKSNKKKKSESSNITVDQWALALGRSEYERCRKRKENLIIWREFYPMLKCRYS